MSQLKGRGRCEGARHSGGRNSSAGAQSTARRRQQGSLSRGRRRPADGAVGAHPKAVSASTSRSRALLKMMGGYMTFDLGERLLPAHASVSIWCYPSCRVSSRSASDTLLV